MCVGFETMLSLSIIRFLFSILFIIIFLFDAVYSRIIDPVAPQRLELFSKRNRQKGRKYDDESSWRGSVSSLDDSINDDSNMRKSEKWNKSDDYDRSDGNGIIDDNDDDSEKSYSDKSNMDQWSGVHSAETSDRKKRK